METWTIFFRTVFIYFFILLMIRIMGKREMGKLTVMDFVVSIMVAELAVIVIEDVKTPLIHGLVPMITLLAIQIGLALIALKNRHIRRLVDGRPSVLIERGKVNQQEMMRMRYNMDDLKSQLRQKNIASISDVEFAILETTGKLSVFLKDEKRPLTREDLQLSSQKKQKASVSYPLPLIIDGKVIEKNLDQVGKNRVWLQREVKKYGISRLSQITFCSINEQGFLYIDAQK